MIFSRKPKITERDRDIAHFLLIHSIAILELAKMQENGFLKDALIKCSENFTEKSQQLIGMKPYQKYNMGKL